MNNKNIFISLPMKDRTSENIRKEISKCFEIIREHTKINNYKLKLLNAYIDPNEDENDRNELWYLGHALEVMSEADIIYFHPNWNSSRGCQIEHEAAKQYGKKIVYLESYLDKRLMNSDY